MLDQMKYVLLVFDKCLLIAFCFEMNFFLSDLLQSEVIGEIIQG